MLDRKLIGNAPMECSLRERFQGLFWGGAIATFQKTANQKTAKNSQPSLSFNDDGTPHSLLGHLLSDAQIWLEHSEFPRQSIPQHNAEPVPDPIALAGTPAMLVIARLLLVTLMHHDVLAGIQTAVKGPSPLVDRVRFVEWIDPKLKLDAVQPSEWEALRLLSHCLSACLVGQSLTLRWVDDQCIENQSVDPERSLLSELNHLLQSKVPLTQVQQTFCRPERSPLVQIIAIALYCWLSTPLEVRTGIGRSLHPRHPAGTASLTGALFGATLGKYGLKAAYTFPTGSSHADDSLKNDFWADQLFCLWAGILDSKSLSLDCVNPGLAIAAPTVLKSRNEPPNSLIAWY